MVSKEEDKAICEAATPGPWAVDPNAEDRTDVVSVSQRCAVCYVPDEGSPDGAFIAAARNRLPLYIADAEEMERRIATLADIANDPETHHATASVLLRAVKILRGEQ